MCPFSLCREQTQKQKQDQATLAVRIFDNIPPVPYLNLNHFIPTTSCSLFTFLLFDSYAQIKNIFIDKLGRFELPLATNNQQMHLLYIIKNKDGSKILKLQSSVKVRNRTINPIDVRIKMPENIALDGPEFVTVAPSKSVYLPLECAGKCCII